MLNWRHCLSLLVLTPLAQQAVALPAECANWNINHPDWIWCDDFESDSKLDVINSIAFGGVQITNNPECLLSGSTDVRLHLVKYYYPFSEVQGATAPDSLNRRRVSTPGAGSVLTKRMAQRLR